MSCLVLARACLSVGRVLQARAQTFVVGNGSIGTESRRPVFGPRTGCLLTSDSEGRLVRIEPGSRSNEVAGEIGFSDVKSLAMAPDSGIL